MNPEVVVHEGIFHAIWIFVICGVFLFPTNCFFKKFVELLGRLDHQTQQQDEARILKLVGVSVEHGLRAVWIASLAIVVIYVSIGFSLSLYRYLHTVAKLF